MTRQREKHTFQGPAQPSPATKMPAILFDLDGTLIDSNYQHVVAWSETLLAAGIVIPRWKIHRRVGMSGKSMIQELLRELGHKKGTVDLDQLEREHGRRFRRAISQLQPLPGANQLMKCLSRREIRFAIATTGGRQPTALLLKLLELPAGTPVVTGDDV
jgi:beta-phosphoglucomutase-like phosphatase (HAD superfamily)